MIWWARDDDAMPSRALSLLVAGLVGASLFSIEPAGSAPPVSWSDRIQPINQRLVNRQQLAANVAVPVAVPVTTLTVGTGDTAENSTLPTRAVLVDITIVSPRSAGYVSAWASGAWPGTSVLNFTRTMQLDTNLAFVQVADDGTFQLMSSTDVTVVVDLVATFPVAAQAVVP
jgi:hypothetical protein